MQLYEMLFLKNYAISFWHTVVEQHDFYKITYKEHCNNQNKYHATLTLALS